MNRYRTSISLDNDDLKLFNSFREDFKKRHGKKSLTNQATFLHIMHGLNMANAAKESKTETEFPIVHAVELHLTFKQKIKLLFGKIACVRVSILVNKIVNVIGGNSDVLIADNFKEAEILAAQFKRTSDLSSVTGAGQATKFGAKKPFEMPNF